MEKANLLNRAVIYARVASNSHNMKEINAQRACCEQYIKEQGYELAGVISSCGASGSVRHMAAMSDLRKGARAGSFDKIIVVNLARISRSPQEIKLFIDEMSACGVTVESVNEPKGVSMLCHQ